jgi:hypothetical protein
MVGEEVSFLKKTRSVYFVAYSIVIIMMASVVIFTRSAADSIGQPSHGIPWTWPSILFADFLLLLAAGVLLFEGWANLHIRFTETEVIKPGLFGPKVIRWCDVVKVVKVTSRGGIRIVGRGCAISVNPFVFKEPEKLDAYLEQKHPNR